MSMKSLSIASGMPGELSFTIRFSIISEITMDDKSAVNYHHWVKVANHFEISPQIVGQMNVA